MLTARCTRTGLSLVQRHAAKLLMARELPLLLASFSSASSSADSTDAATLGDRCDLHIVHSPFPEIKPGPYPTLAEFVSEDWTSPQLLNKVGILDGTTGESRTFSDFYMHMINIAGALKDEFGIGETSTVALICPNHVDYLSISLAVSLTGAKLTPINPLYTNDELETLLNRCHAKVLMAHSSTLEKSLEVAKKCKSVEHVVVIPSSEADSTAAVPEGTIHLSYLKEHYRNPLKKTVRKAHLHGTSHPVLLPYSSGTTGLPKGVCLSHDNIVTNLLQMEQVEGISFPRDHKLISPLPFFHIYAFTISMLYSAWQGQQLITMSGRFDYETFCKLVEEHKPERAHLVPPILLAMAKSPITQKYSMESLGMVISAAAPLGSDIEGAVKEKLHCGVKQGWGMSELSPLGTLSSDYEARPGSVGLPISSTFCKVMDPETGKSLGPGESGELWIKGPQVMMGYLDDPEKTAACISPNGWLKTGDIAHYDEDNFFYITDRLKELIKVRGYQVAPAELEALLLTNEHVRDTAVIGIPDEASGELPRACVVLADNNNEESSRRRKITEEDIQAWVKERVAPFKRLDGGVRFVDVIPKSPSGKILRRLIRDEHLA